jgi:Protein tyrosine and serine/threonine kinase
MLALDFLFMRCSVLLGLTMPRELQKAFVEYDQQFQYEAISSFDSNSNKEVRHRQLGYACLFLNDGSKALEHSKTLSLVGTSVVHKFFELTLRLGTFFVLYGAEDARFCDAVIELLELGPPPSSPRLVSVLFRPCHLAAEVVSIAFCMERFALRRNELRALLRQLVDVMFGDHISPSALRNAAFFWYGRWLELSGYSLLGLKAVQRCFDKLATFSIPGANGEAVRVGEQFAAQAAFHMARRAEMIGNHAECLRWDQEAAKLWQNHDGIRFFLQHPSFAQGYAMRPQAWRGWDSTGRDQDVRFLEGLVLGERIAGGQFGSVFKAQWKGSVVAAKFLTNASDASSLQELNAEATILSSLSAPNCVQFFGLAQIDSGGLALVMEYMELGSALDLVRKRDVERNHLVWLARDVAAGMSYLSSAEVGITHGGTRTFFCYMATLF